MRMKRNTWRAVGLAVGLAVAGAVVAPAAPALAIIGGTQVPFSDHPYFARVSTSLGTKPCGGSVIADGVVLTAASCVNPAVTTFVSVAGGAAAPGTVTLHPLWNGDVRDGHDLALIRVPPAVTAPVPKIQVGSPFDTGVYATGNPARIMGTGRTIPNGLFQPMLHVADTVLHSDDFMDDIYNPIFGSDHWVEPLMIGAGDPGRTICQGDEGSPLVVTDLRGRPVQVGVASFTPSNCGKSAGFAELRGAQLAWLASEVPSIVDRWDACPSITPGHPVSDYTTTPISYAERDGAFYWRMYCAPHQDRLGPSLAVGPSGQWRIAFQANTGALWTRSHDGSAGPVSGPRMALGTSPSIVALPSGGYRIAYQGINGMLHTVSASGVTTDLGLGMAAGTSPSIAMQSDGQWRIAFQANTGALWTRSLDGSEGPVPGNRMMWPGTSPSIVALPTGGYQIAYQSSDGILHTVSPAGVTTSLGLGMAAGTSPSIAAQGTGWRIAFQANTGMLWTRNSDVTGGPVAGNRAVRRYTSPSVAAMPTGGFRIAYQTSDGMLGMVSPQGGTTSLFLGMSGGSSPSLAPVSGSGDWLIAFEANTWMLWRRASSGQAEDLRLGLQPG
jgi:hypothetical protein